MASSADLARLQALLARIIPATLVAAGGIGVAIAGEETAHAALSWDLAEWLDSLLSESERSAVRAARLQAVAELEEELRLPPDAALARSAGLPTSEVAVWMLDTAATALGVAA